MNQSLQKKTAARMAAVQSLYQASITEETPSAEAQVAALKLALKGNPKEQLLQMGLPVEPDYKLFEAMLAGVKEHEQEIDMRLGGALNEKWRRERMSPILVALLQCAIFELFFHKNLNSKIVIDEYTRLTHSFFAEPEVNFVHGALQALLKQYG